MVLKLLGASLLVISASIGGFYFSLLDKYRIEELEQAKRMLSILESEMVYSSLLLTDAFYEISKRVSGSIAATAEIFSKLLAQQQDSSISNLWKQALMQGCKQSYFRAEDIETFSDFGRALGYLDKGQQISNIKITRDYIETTQDTLRKHSQKNSKIYRSMGILTGLLIAIILF